MVISGRAIRHLFDLEASARFGAGISLHEPPHPEHKENELGVGTDALYAMAMATDQPPRTCAECTLLLLGPGLRRPACQTRRLNRSRRDTAKPPGERRPNFEVSTGGEIRGRPGHHCRFTVLRRYSLTTTRAHQTTGTLPKPGVEGDEPRGREIFGFQLALPALAKLLLWKLLGRR